MDRARIIAPRVKTSKMDRTASISVPSTNTSKMDCVNLVIVPASMGEFHFYVPGLFRVCGTGLPL